MDDAELVGGVLVDADDPRASADELARLLLATLPDRAAAMRAGLHPELVGVLRARFGQDHERIAMACQEGAAHCP